MAYSNYLLSRVKNFMSRYSDDIVDSIKGTGIFLATIGAMKAYESDYGDSDLAVKYNNLGGIKNFGDTPFATSSVMLDTTEYKNGKRVPAKQPFAVFATPADSFKSFITLLQSPSKNYTTEGVFTATSPEEQIKRIAQAGYTTTPATTYLKNMQGIVDAIRDTYKIGKVN